jgi:hypothetical protein
MINKIQLAIITLGIVITSLLTGCTVQSTESASEPAQMVRNMYCDHDTGYCEDDDSPYLGHPGFIDRRTVGQGNAFDTIIVPNSNPRWVNKYPETYHY